MFTETSIPTKIIIGNESASRAYAEQALCAALCPNKISDCFCSVCRAVKNNQHATLRSINPEKTYTVAHIDAILEESRLTRDPGELFFFVLFKTETLTTAAANRLLKLLEEPPAHYFFLLLTNNLTALLPTIVSRSHIIRLEENSTTKESLSPICSFFCPMLQTSSPIQFEQALMREELSDARSIEYVYEIFAWYTKQLKQVIHSECPDQSVVDYYTLSLNFLHTLMAMPPQSGSSTIFWKMAFMNFPRECSK